MGAGKAARPAESRQLAECWRDTQWLCPYKASMELLRQPYLTASWRLVCRDTLGHDSHMALPPARPSQATIALCHGHEVGHCLLALPAELGRDAACWCVCCSCCSSWCTRSCRRWVLRVHRASTSERVCSAVHGESSCASTDPGRQAFCRPAAALMVPSPTTTSLPQIALECRKIWVIKALSKPLPGRKLRLVLRICFLV